MQRLTLLAAVLAVLAGCLPYFPPTPTQQYTPGTVLLDEDFSDPYSWQEIVDSNLGADFRISDNAYHAHIAPESFMWALNRQMHDDVIIEVDAWQVSDYNDNAYGVMCRADPANSGEGYYFIISGDGFWTIRRGRSDRAEALVEFSHSPAIKKGTALNKLRVICIDDYLALYINGEFAGETHDRMYSRGYAGLTVASAGNAATEIQFDNVIIAEGRLGSPD